MSQVLICPDCGLAHTDPRQHRDWHVDQHLRRLTQQRGQWRGDVAADPADGAVLQAFERLVDITRQKRAERDAAAEVR